MHPVGAEVLAVAAAACAFTLACSGGGVGARGSGGDASSDAGAPKSAAVYDEILVQSCALAFCHAGGNYLIITSKDQGYRALVNAPAQGSQCAPTGLKLVDPGHPETSLLYLKITNPPCGSKMPLSYGYSGSLDPRQIDQIGQWIEAGAPDN